MTGQVAPTGRLGTVKIRAWWWVAGFGALVLIYLIAGRVAETISRWPATINEAVAPSHCDQFIALAKAAYGGNWRVRLDPRDTTCDSEVRAAWERQLLPREVPDEATATLAPQPVVAPVTEGPADTYCLNVISLAKAKYGAAWHAKVDPACAQERESGR